MSRTPPSRRADFAAFRSLTTRWKDNDAYGHINNASYYSFIDTAITLWQIEAGMDISGPGGLRFVAAASGCTYFEEARFPDVLHLGMRVSRIGSSSGRYEVGVFRNDDDRACTEGFFVHVCVDEAMRPLPIPDPARAAFESLLHPSGGAGSPDPAGPV